MSPISRKNFLTLLITMLVVALSIYSFIAHIPLGSVFNSDQISIPYLYEDLFQHQGLMKNWKFSFDNYLFPDTIIYFFSRFFVHDFRMAIILADSIILVSYYLSIVSLGSLVCGEQSRNLFRLSALVSLTLISGHLGDLFTPLLTSHLSGNVIVYLLELFLIIKLLIRPRIIYWVWLFTLVLLTLFSDPLCLIILVGSVLTAIAGIFRTAAKNQQSILIKIGVLLPGISILNFFLTRHNPFHLNIVRAKLNFLFNIDRAIISYRNFLGFYRENPILMLLVLTHLIIVIWFFIKLNIPKSDKKSLNRLGVNALLVLFSASSALVILIFFSIAFDPDLTVRSPVLLHFIPAILVPVFVGFPILLASYTNIAAIVNKFYMHFLAILLLNLLIFGSYKSLRPFVNYYPDVVRCLDHYDQTGQLLGKNGVSNYWQAHPYSILSKQNLNIVAVNPDYSPFDWMSTTSDYLNKKFNFVILITGEANFKPYQAQLKKLGAPHAILKCQDDKGTFIYTYSQGFFIHRQ